MFLVGFFLYVWISFFKGFALIINQMLKHIWFKVITIARIDNLSFLASVKNISKSASCICQLLPAGDSSQFALGGTGFWQAFSQHGNAVMWQQGYQVMSVLLHSMSRTSATVEMGSGVAGRAWRKERGQQGRGWGWDEKGNQGGGQRGSSTEIDRNWSWEGVRVAGRKESHHQDSRGVCHPPGSMKGWISSAKHLLEKEQILCSYLLTWTRIPKVHWLFYLLVK